MNEDSPKAAEMEEKASRSAIDPKIREKVLKEEPKAQKELAKWQKEKARPKRSFYLWYLMLILTLVYIVDEVATNLNSTMQPYMIEDFFMGVEGLDKNAAPGKMGWLWRFGSSHAGHHDFLPSARGPLWPQGFPFL
jgi:predicted nucleic acid-binding Zn ribbon protein